MKAIYPQRNKTRNESLKRVAILISVFIIGAIIFSIFDGAIISLASPVWKADNVMMRNIRDGFSFFYTQKNLVKENNELRQRLSEIESKYQSLSSREIQEKNLLKLLGRNVDKNFIAASILARPPQTPYDIILIDVGQRDGVTFGSDVVMPEGPILGKVGEVFQKSARVKLFSSSGEKTNAMLERNNLPVTLIGFGGGNFKINLPRDTHVEKGDKILSSDIEARLVAIVEDINMNSTDSFKEVLAKSPINIFVMRYVFVIP